MVSKDLFHGADVEMLMGKSRDCWQASKEN